MSSNDEATGRVCTKCGVWKEWEEFHLNCKGVNGRQGKCKACVSEEGKAARAPHEVAARAGRVASAAQSVTATGRVCTKCGEWKEWGEFGVKGSGARGRPPTCKLCSARRGQDRRDADPQGWNEYARTWKRNHRVSAMFSRAKGNAGERGLPFLLSRETDIPRIARIIDEGVCQLTGLPFDLTHGCRKPNAPSLDRIDSTKGYVPGNVRVVLWQVNAMMNEYGEDALLEVADAIRQQRAVRQGEVMSAAA